MTKEDKYLWLFKSLYDSPDGITLSKLSDKWRENMSYNDKPLNRTTFDRWKSAIEPLFDISIENERRPPYRYYIANREDIENNKLNKWLLDSMSIGNALKDTAEIKERILLENIPSGHTHLATIVTAMKHNHKVQITFRGFDKVHSSTFAIDPLCIKSYNNRWYVVGDSYPYGELQRRIYGLDRIEKSTELEESFTFPQDFNPSDYFNDYIGVSRRADPIEEPIKFRVYNPHKYYIMSLPIHHSQRLLVDEGDYAEFEVTVAPTEEFFMEMLHGGSWIEVLSPTEVVNEMKRWVNDLYNVYNQK